MLVCVCVGVCMLGFCNVWVCVSMGFVMCGCFNKCVGFVMCGCVYVWAFVCLGFVMCGCVFLWVL